VTFKGALPLSYLLRGGHVYSSVDPFATAMLVIDGRIGWIGSDAGAEVHADSVAQVIDLDGALVTPAFVDAHVHLTATGVGLLGLDLTGTRSAGGLLDRVASFAATQPAAVTIWGHGWDDSAWDSGLPTRAELDVACGGRPMYLSRIDVHSALVSSALIDRSGDVASASGFDPTGPLSQEAALRVRETAFASLDAAQRRAAQVAALTEAAAHGIASVHEMAGPGISSSDDLRSALHLGREAAVPEVIGYWGELLAIDTARDLGAHGCAGDLFADGSLGSHTACLRAPYTDASDTSGVGYLDSEAVAQHVIACTEAELQAGFHVIGDRATDTVIGGFRVAEDTLGAAAVRRAGHRLEHAEMLDAVHREVMARLGIAASMQPAFDAAWGGPGGMYQTRLGPQRARQLNPLAAVVATGITLALGSDAPVTPLRPWEAVRAAAFHHQPEHRISVKAAFAAHTRGGRRAAGHAVSQPGVLADGAPATYAIWQPSELVVTAPDTRVSAWSTDPRSGTPGLPDLGPGRPVPAAWRTVRDGQVIFDAGVLAGLDDAEPPRRPR
jgi:predicted amidohydrolase YtcJ